MATIFRQSRSLVGIATIFGRSHFLVGIAAICSQLHPPCEGLDSELQHDTFPTSRCPDCEKISKLFFARKKRVSPASSVRIHCLRNQFKRIASRNPS